MHGNVIEELASVLVHASPDILEHAVHALTDGHANLSSLSADTLTELVTAAVLCTGGEVLRQYVKQHPEELRVAIRRGLAAL